MTNNSNNNNKIKCIIKYIIIVMTLKLILTSLILSILILIKLIGMIISTTKKNDINETVFFIWFPETREWIWTIEIKHPLVQCESRLHPGTKIPFLNDHIKSTMRSSEADKTAVHVGTNDLASDEITMQIYKDIIRLVASIRNDNINPVIS